MYVLIISKIICTNVVKNCVNVLNIETDGLLLFASEQKNM